MFYQLTFFSLFFSLLMLSVNCSAGTIRVQNRTFYSFSLTCDNVDYKNKRSEKIKWVKIKHNSSLSMPCTRALYVARSRDVKKIARSKRVAGLCTQTLNLHKHLLRMNEGLRTGDAYGGGYTLNGFPTALYVCWKDITVKKPKHKWL